MAEEDPKLCAHRAGEGLGPAVKPFFALYHSEGRVGEFSLQRTHCKECSEVHPYLLRIRRSLWVPSNSGRLAPSPTAERCCAHTALRCLQPRLSSHCRQCEEEGWAEICDLAVTAARMGIVCISIMSFSEVMTLKYDTHYTFQKKMCLILFCVYHRILLILCNLFNENEATEEPMCFFTAVKNTPYLYIELSQRMTPHIPIFLSHILD